MQLVDANIILRYLLNDVPEQSERARAIIEDEQAYAYPEVLAEVVYVLSGVYGCSRAEIGTVFRRLLKCMFFYDAEMLLSAFNYYELTSMDFVDCLLAARSLCMHEQASTFDKQLARIIGQQT